MAEKELFQIGDVAKMYHLSVGTLRHYEQIGLLLPEKVDPRTGYRYYGVRQFELLNNIRYLRALEMPLEEITAYMQNRDVDSIEEKLLHQKELIARKKQELDQMERKIDNRLAQIADTKKSKLDVVQLVELPAFRVVGIRDSIRFDSYLWLEKSLRRLQENQKTPLIFQGKVGAGVSKEHLLAGEYKSYDLVFLLLDKEDDYEGRVETVPAGSYVTVRYHGSHGEAEPYYAKMMAYIRANGLDVTGFSQELALIDNSISTNPESYITEIRIPVRTAGQGSCICGKT